LKRAPEVFHVDTDSVEFIVDTGMNGFIVNDRRLLEGYAPIAGKVKGVNGKGTDFTGIGNLRLTLKSDCGSQVRLTVKGVVVPHCPYNLLSPQLLVREMKRQGLSANCSYDDVTHSIHFVKADKPHVITSFAKSNQLFSVWSNEGYRSFFGHAVTTDPKWCSFAGALHIIPDDDHNQPEIGQSREDPPKRERESSNSDGQTRKPTTKEFHPLP